MAIKKRPGPFRRGTPRNVFQTVDIGSGLGEYLSRQAKRFPERKYAVVDPRYRIQPEGFDAKAILARGILSARGVLIRPDSLKSFVWEMLRNGWRTRHFNLDMPEPLETTQYYSLGLLFENAPKLLLPNGKIFVSSDREDVITSIDRLARRNGLKTRALQPITQEHPKRLTESMRMYAELDTTGKKIHQLEITLGLKKAIPDKKKRREWTKSPEKRP